MLPQAFLSFYMRVFILGKTYLTFCRARVYQNLKSHYYSEESHKERIVNKTFPPKIAFLQES